MRLLWNTAMYAHQLASRVALTLQDLGQAEQARPLAEQARPLAERARAIRER
jgi:hypothetical protein